MKIKNLSRIALLTAMLIMGCKSWAQSNTNLELRALNYFCTVIVDSEKLSNDYIRFPSQLNKDPIDLYNLAYALGEIDLFNTNSHDNRQLDSLNKLTNNIMFERTLPKQRSCGNPKGKTRYGLTVYKSRMYKEHCYVQINLFNKKAKSEQMIFIQFNQDIPVRYYSKILTFD